MLYVFFLVFSVFMAGTVCASNAYKDDDKVVLYVNKIGPYFNPHETYHYFHLPVCRPNQIVHKSLTLGEVLDGDRMAESMYDLHFKVPVKEKELCSLKLLKSEVETLKSAIEDLYFFEFVIDDIPLRGFLGHLDEGSIFPHTHKIDLWTHHTFNILYNENQIIYANVTVMDHAPTSLTDTNVFPLELKFTYTVNWIPTTVQFGDRGKLVNENAFFPKHLEIHWLSIINSIVLVFLLIGFVAIILTRILKHDFARYNPEELEIDDEADDDNGWKIIHTDVFRFPPLTSLFCAILGVGVQFLIVFTSVLLMAVLGLFNVHHHGSINSAAIVLFAFASSLSGYVAATMYKLMGGTAWVWNVNLTSVLFAAPFFMIWSFVNSVEWAYGSTQALPWGTIVMIGALWLFIGYPLTVIGGIFGKNWAQRFDAPCRTKNISREIPPVACYRSPIVYCLIGGFLPFSAVSVELYYIFATLWGREQYTLYGILFIVYVIALSVTACISITLTYFQLSAEDYRWWWRSVFSGGMTGLFVLLYAIFYFVKRSNMSGFLQTVEFFGYTILVCYVFFLVLGTVSFFASLRFVKYIYANVKMD